MLMGRIYKQLHVHVYSIVKVEMKIKFWTRGFAFLPQLPIGNGVQPFCAPFPVGWLPVCSDRLAARSAKY